MSRTLLGTTAQHTRRLRSYCSFWLILSILLVDSFALFEHGWQRAEVVQADTGDFSVFREATGTQVIAGTGNDVTWDTSVTESTNISLQGNTSDIDLGDGGKYLVMYNTWTEEGSTGGANRRSIASYLTLNDLPLEYGWGGGYIRDSENDFSAYNTGAAIIDATAGDDLAVVLDRDDTNPGGGSAIKPGTNGVSVVKLDDDLDYLRVHKSLNSADISGNTGFTPVEFDSTDELDTGSFALPAGTDVTLSGPAGQFFLVTTNVKLNTTGGGRSNYDLRLTLDGAEIDGARTSAYLRASDGDNNSTLQYVGVIEKTTAADQTLQVQVRREGAIGFATTIQGDQTALAVAALPDSVQVLSLTTGTDQTLTTAQSAFAFDVGRSAAPTYFTHSTTTDPNQITVNQAGNYLVFATSYTSRTSGTGRDVPRIDWRLDSATQPYGGHGAFNRGDQGTQDTFSGGGSGGAVFAGLGIGQVLELTHQDETTGTPVSVFAAGRVGVQLIELSTLNEAATTNVSLNGSQQTTGSIPDTDVESGIQLVVSEVSAGRNITNVVLSETGSIDAATGLSNIRLFYDIDASAPYDCTSESYGGSELQFGAAGAFSGADGTVTFNDSVSISPTTAFCGYVVYDVTSSASDGQTINFSVNDPTADIIVTGGGVLTPASTLGNGTVTTLVDAEITQTGYHWRNDDGSEAGATSATGGVENTPGLAFSAATPQRLRVGVAGQGTGAATQSFRLEYGQKVTTCSAVSTWESVDAVGGAWDMFDSANVFEGANTTNIAVGVGGVTDGGTAFVTPNGGLRDVTSQTGSITIENVATGPISEFGNTTVTNGTLTTINLTETFYDPVVVASVRFPRTDTQRTPRIDNKASSSFDILIDNYDSSLTGTTNIDYVVFERGDWLVDDGGSGVRVYADSVDTTVSAGRPLVTDPGGPTVTYPTAFSGEPAVITTVVTRNDPQWTFASVYQGSNIINPPSATNTRLFLNDNFDADGHSAAETIDFVVFETGHATSNGFEFDAVTTGAATVSNTPVAVTYDTAYGATPAVILTQSLTHNGTDGGYSQIDTNTAPTASAVTVTTDEDGESSIGELADRAHAAEEVAVVSFASGGTFVGERTDLSEFVELEYSLQATGAALQGVAYCFRVSDAGSALKNYTVYPEATLNADVTVGASGSYVATVNADATNQYLGGQFSAVSNSGNHTLTELTFTETGTVDATQHVSNFRMYYESDTTNPRDCSSESYDGTESFVTGSAFVSDNGTTSVTLSSPVRTNESFCAYLVVDIASTAPDGATVAFTINNPNNDVVIAGASVGPGSTVAPTGNVTVNAPSLTQTVYHWRNDDGSEIGATSATGGVENTPVAQVFQGTTRRLRLALANDGSLTESSAALRLEYGTKVTTCANIGVWQRINDGVAFDMATAANLTDGSDTTDIAVSAGGVSNPATTFLTPNGGQLSINDEAGALTLGTTQFVELEYAVEVTDTAGFGATYCFRVTDAGEPIGTYTNYPELTVQDRQDFFVQRGTQVVSGIGQTLAAGVDYVAPSSNGAAFVRITNTNLTGAGSITLGSNRNPDDITAYISGPVDLTTGFTITRPPAATDNTRVSWEIIEYIGVIGGDNEFIVRTADEVTYGGSNLTATGASVAGVADDDDVVVFITGQLNPAPSTADFNTGMSVSSWTAGTDQPVFTRGDADGIAAGVSYAVVEFTGANWQVQRAEHTYTAAGTTEIESITAVNSPARTFLHTQKNSGDELFNLDENGHEVWLSSIGAVSFLLESGSTNPSQQTSVAWVIENTQLGAGAMQVYRSNGTITQGGVQPITVLSPIGNTVNISNATIWANARSSGAGSAHPRSILGARIVDETQIELWKSDEGQNQAWRVEVVEWPVAETSIRQSHYRLYVDNDTLTPTDPWPAGASDLGENTAMTDLDEPLGEGEQIRIRTGLFVNNASLITDTSSFKLQYGRRVTTCSAVGTWTDLGDPGGPEIWRGTDATPADGATLPSGLLSVTNQLGSYEEQNPSVSNPSTVGIGEYIEYDWHVEHNGALQKSSYCFRMVYSDGADINGYDVYPTIRTTGYTPVIVNWQWFDDETSLTPGTALSAEQVAPIEITASNTLKLRIAATEVEGAPGNNIKFNLQYSTWADFRDGGTTLTATSSCTGEPTRTWCYADGAGDDNDIITSTVLTGVDSCVAGVGNGCGTRNEAQGLTSTYDQPAFATSEHEFTLLHNSVGFDQVYYFRMVDATNGVPLVASTTFPSITTEGAKLTFVIAGITGDQITEGITLDATTTATDIDFGSLPFGSSAEAGQRLTVFTNGTEGYQVFLAADQQLTNSNGETIAPVTGTNAAPQPWATACVGGASGCFGYHAGDNILGDGSVRFASNDTYAALSLTPVEIMASNVPVTFDQSDIVFRAQVDELQSAGDYMTTLRYIIVPTF